MILSLCIAKLVSCDEEIPEEILEDEEEAQTPNEGKEGSSVKAKSPWKTGVHHMTPEDPQLPQMELEEPIQELRRTTRKISLIQGM